MAYSSLAILWGNKVLKGEKTIEQVPKLIRDEVIKYVEEQSRANSEND